MNIIVCIKQVPNTNEVTLDTETGTLIREGIPSIINPDDKAALEAALQTKDLNGAKVTALTMGPLQAEEALREAYAMGVDETILITDRAFSGSDTWATSSTLAAAIQKLDYDLIITGRQAIDGDTAQVGPQIAEHLGVPNVSYAEEFWLEDTHVVVKQHYEDRYHIVKVKMPCLLTALSGFSTPRYMTPGGIYDAHRIHKITKWHRDDLSVKDTEIGLKGSPTRVVKSFTKELKGKGTIMNVDTDEAVDFLVEKLQEKYVL